MNKLHEHAPLRDLTYRVTGVAMRVHREMLRGLREGEYHRALHVALIAAGLEAEFEPVIPAVIDGVTVGLLRPDLVVPAACPDNGDHLGANDGSVRLPVEVKALRHTMTNDELAQVIAYIAVLEAPVGLYLNFGRPSLEHRRILPPRQITDRQRLLQRALHTESSRRTSASHP